MTDSDSDHPNRNVLWARTIVSELAAAGVDAVSVAPGSRSTPLTVAAHEHEELVVHTHLDERSAAYFALGRALRTGQPTPLICTSGTAAANFHPAVIEADRARVPTVLLTADRPPELRDSGANQTIDQVDLYGDAVRWFRDLPEPEPADRKLRRLRVDVARAVATATGTPPGPVHLDVPFRKPLEPLDVADERLSTAGDGAAPAAEADSDDPRPPAGGVGRGFDGRDGAYVRTHRGTAAPPTDAVEDVAADLAASERVLLVAGPGAPVADGAGGDLAGALADLAAATGAPLLADPLSGARFGPHVEHCPLVCGGYDAYLGTTAADGWPEPEVVLRVGASPTSKPLRKYLAATDARQVLVDPAGEWRDAEFATSDLVTADPASTASALADAVRERGVGPDASERSSYREQFARAEAAHWRLVDAGTADVAPALATVDGDVDVGGTVDGDVDVGRTVDGDADGDDTVDADDVPAADDALDADDLPNAEDLEGATVPAVLAALPERATLFASNSMPVRDLDRFAPPSTRRLTALANRGASGVDGITSTALGAASAGAEPLVAVVGDLAFLHDVNGLLAAERCDVDATIVVVNNDGGGIFHALPIEAFDPPFTEGFRTPHGRDLAHAADLYDVGHRRVDLGDLSSACEDAIGTDGVDVLEVEFDADASHRAREALRTRLSAVLRTDRSSV